MRENKTAQAMAEKLVMLKQEFASVYDGNSHIQEILPDNPRDIQMNGDHLAELHKFARSNPIYLGTQNLEILGVSCTVYEGDINQYWLNSIKHGSSCQPFYPTWILSAYIAAVCAQNLGCLQLADVGSGDGRIAYCGRILGMDTHSIEIDETLTALQSRIAESTGTSLGHVCASADAFDYTGIDGRPAAFFIGGLPQMGGDILADTVISQVLGNGAERKDAVFVFAGSHSRRNLSSSAGTAGWGGLMDRYGMNVLDVVHLPTVWTFDQPTETPYIFAGMA